MRGVAKVRRALDAAGVDRHNEKAKTVSNLRSQVGQHTVRGCALELGARR